MTIEPNDDEDLAVPCSCLRAGIGGTVAYLDLQGNSRTRTVTSGSVTYFGYRRILRTGTTAGELGNSTINPAYNQPAAATGEPQIAMSVVPESLNVSDGAGSFVAGGFGLAGDMTVGDPDEEFEVSLDGETWELALTLSPSVGIVSQEVFVRRLDGEVLTRSGAVVLSSAGAEDVEVAVAYVGPLVVVLSESSVDVSGGQDTCNIAVTNQAGTLAFTVDPSAGFEVAEGFDSFAGDGVAVEFSASALALKQFKVRRTSGQTTTLSGSVVVSVPGGVSDTLAVEFTAAPPPDLVITPSDPENFDPLDVSAGPASFTVGCSAGVELRVDPSAGFEASIFEGIWDAASQATWIGSFFGDATVQVRRATGQELTASGTVELTATDDAAVPASVDVTYTEA